MTIPILILAAGASRRMKGRDKLLEDAHGQPLLRHVVQRAVATGHPVLVALPKGGTARHHALTGLDVQVVWVHDAAVGMAASLRAGLNGIAEEFTAVLVALADMPGIQTEDYLSIINTFECDANENIHRATSFDGTLGNPVLLPKWALSDLTIFQGDAGARDLLRQHADRVRLVALPSDRAITDLDTPEDWARWRQKTPL